MTSLDRARARWGSARLESLSISPVNLFLQAGLVGKIVMAALGLASLWCWVLIIEGPVAIVRLGRAIRAARAGESPAVLEPVAAAGRHAAALDIAAETASERRQRIGEAMARAARETLARAEGGLPNLAIIASVAPFVGLFGTVWGIMTSFAGIAEARDTSLAVVAPGIAEALAATAYGLAAAIPASVGYNRIGAAFSRAGRAMTNLIEEWAVALLAEPRA
jgi:biopolymer transport protein ExbB/TolQ